jgi:hypothetical protein
MGLRNSSIARSIIKALFSTPRSQSLLARILVFFRVFDIELIRFKSDNFDELQLAWKIDKTEYLQSFSTDQKQDEPKVKPVGDLGYSGSVRP